MRCLPRLVALLTLTFGTSLGGQPISAAERFTLNAHTWDDVMPMGKEADAIYGDIVLRNDRIIVVIGQPLPTRNANMTIKNVGGCVIDLTRSAAPSDQLGAFFPGGRAAHWQGDAVAEERSKARVSYSVRSAGELTMETTYTLTDGSDYLLVETTYINKGQKPVAELPFDEIRADRTFTKSPNGSAEFFWAYDKWFDQAYGFAAEGVRQSAATDGNLTKLVYERDGGVAMAPGESFKLARRIFPATGTAELLGIAGAIAGKSQHEYDIRVRDASGQALAKAEVEIMLNGKAYAATRTDSGGRAVFTAPPAAYTAEARAIGSGSARIDLKPGENLATLPVAGTIVAKITDERGGAIPCKVQLRGVAPTVDPHFGNDSCEHGVHNVYYSHNGQFVQPLEPGKYDVIISYGPEYDAVFTQVEVQRGQLTRLAAHLRRSVDSRGWISADFHSHSSPSGDNTSSQLGRVLNLLCEQIEFAPCTEHNRISTYDPHLQALGAAHLLATCSGMELTGSPLPLNHHNAFPLVMHDRTQDNGAPQPDESPEAQIGRLALWDHRSEKLVQQNHPDIGNLFFDKDGNGEIDKGFAAGLPFIDVIEVHPPSAIFGPPTHVNDGKRYNNTIFNWLQLLNQGLRIPGVVNTDAHYNFHGSGFLRIYVQCPTDNPADVQVLDIVHAAEHGHVIMTSGPFLEVIAKSSSPNGERAAISGDDLLAADGKLTLHVRVQCPNWFDIDRVQVFVNGRPDSKYDFRRATQAKMFADGALKFDQRLPVELMGDAHLVVVAAGGRLGPVMGPDHGNDMPIAVSNPIFVDVDGDGFKPNGDTLDAPLPTKEGKAAK